jgi:hypothetical protein
MAATGPGAAPQSANPPEIQGHETTPQFRIRAEPNLVVVPDAKGRTVGDLHKEDFRLFDDGTLTSTGKDQSDFTARRVKPHEALLYLPPDRFARSPAPRELSLRVSPKCFWI